MSEVLAFYAMLFVSSTIAFVATLWFIRRLLELRHERFLRRPTDDLSERLARIETTVESTALEVERIAEANRYVAKILAERGASVAPLSKSPERLITPH
jgi:sensor domain CHASE-containing protein